MRAAKVSSSATPAAKVSKTRSTSSVGKTTKSRTTIKRRSVDTKANIKGKEVDLKNPTLASADKTGTKSSLSDRIKDSAKSKLNDMKAEATATLQNKMDNLTNIAYNAGVDMINSAKNQLVDYLNSVLVIPEPVLLETLKKIADVGGTPMYKNYYALRQMLIKDYSTIVAWMQERFNLSLTSGTDGQVFSRAPKYGATRTSLLVTRRQKEVLDGITFDKDRYQKIKEIIVYCKTNFQSTDIISIMNEYNILPSGFGSTGCEEFGKRYMITDMEVNLFLPERKNGLIWETYPRTIEHVELMKKMLSGGLFGSEDKMTHKTIYKRIYNNVVIYNPVQTIANTMVKDMMKELGIDKIIGLCTNPEQLMYLYIEYLKKQKMF